MTLGRFVGCVAVVAAITAWYRHVLHLNPATVGFTFLLAVLIVSAVWGLHYALFVAFSAAFAYNYFFLPPFGTLSIEDPKNWAALLAFFVTGVIGSQLAERARREAANAVRRRSEIERLYTLSQKLLSEDNMLAVIGAIPRHVAETFLSGHAALFLLDAGKTYAYPDPADAVIARARLEQAAARNEWILAPANGVTCIPLRVGGNVIGALGVAGASLSRETLEAVASLVAIAIQHAGAVEQLAHAEAERESEELRAALLDSVAHEFRTPLTAIKASAQSLLGNAALDDASRSELLAVINEESDRLDRLVSKASEMTQLDAHAVELQRSPQPIRVAIDAAIELTRTALARHQLVIDSADALPVVDIDVYRIAEVLSQLLDNAAKYSPPGTTITVRATATGDSVKTSVADEGRGIETLDQGLIFDKFYRGIGHRYTVPGTGMGLPIAKAIVEAHGGTMGVTSHAGRGSVFHFALPISRR